MKISIIGACKFYVLFLTLLFTSAYAADLEYPKHALHGALVIKFRKNTLDGLSEPKPVFSQSCTIVDSHTIVTAAHGFVIFKDELEENSKLKEFEEKASEIKLLYQNRFYTTTKYHIHENYVSEEESNKGVKGFVNPHDVAVVWFDKEIVQENIPQSFYTYRLNRSSRDIAMMGYKYTPTRSVPYIAKGKIIKSLSALDLDKFIYYAYSTHEDVKETDGISGAIVYQKDDVADYYSFFALHNLGVEVPKTFWESINCMAAPLNKHEGVGRLITQEIEDYIRLESTLFRKNTIIEQLTHYVNPDLGDTYRPVLLSLQTDYDYLYIKRFLISLRETLKSMIDKTDIIKTIFDCVIVYDGKGTNHGRSILSEYSPSFPNNKIICHDEPVDLSLEDPVLKTTDKPDLTLNGLDVMEYYYPEQPLIILALSVGCDSIAVHNKIIETCADEGHIYHRIPCIPSVPENIDDFNQQHRQKIIEIANLLSANDKLG
jgi:hypothetical protein